MTLQEIMDDLAAQLAWRGPGDKPQGHIVMPRSEAQELLDYIRDALDNQEEHHRLQAALQYIAETFPMGAATPAQYAQRTLAAISDARAADTSPGS